VSIFEIPVRSDNVLQIIPEKSKGRFPAGFLPCSPRWQGVTLTLPSSSTSGLDTWVKFLHVSSYLCRHAGRYSPTF